MAALLSPNVSRVTLMLANNRQLILRLGGPAGPRGPSGIATNAALLDAIAEDVPATQGALGLGTAAYSPATAFAAASDLNNEVTARVSADTALNTALASEASARASADTTLAGAISDEVTARNTAIATALTPYATVTDFDNFPAYGIAKTAGTFLAGAMLLANATGTAYASMPMSGHGTINEAGVLALTPPIEMGTLYSGAGGATSFGLGGDVGATRQYGFHASQRIPAVNAGGYVTYAAYPALETDAIVSDLYGYVAVLPSASGTGHIVNAYGFISADMPAVTGSAYGVASNVSAGTNRWSFYAGDSAPSYFAGGFAVGASVALPADALVALNSTTKGWLPPRMTTTQKNAIASPTAGLVLYDSTLGKLAYRNASAWVAVGDASFSGTGTTANFGRGEGTYATSLLGPMGIGSGSATVTARQLYVSGNITGAVTAYGVSLRGTAQSDVTSTTYGYHTSIDTQATSFTLANLRHYAAAQSTFGAGSTVSSQVGFWADSTLSGATNNYAFRGEIAASGTNNWNLYCGGTANNYMAGSLGIGSTSFPATNLGVNKALTGAVTSYSVRSQGTVQSDVTSTGIGFYTNHGTQAAAFTLNQLIHFQANQGTIGAGSTVSFQTGFYVDNGLTGATTNYGFYSAIPSGTGRWNLYMVGTASNYLAGPLGLGSNSLGAYGLRNSLNVTGATTAYACANIGAVQSDVTSVAYGYYSALTTQATSFTLGGLRHFGVVGGTVGAGSTITAQYGFIVDSTMTGATTNYGFYGALAVSGTARWNAYMTGTAPSYFAGQVAHGTTALDASALAIFTSTTQGVLLPRMTTTQRDAISSPAAGLLIYNTTTGKLNVRGASAWEAVTSA